MQKLVGYTRVSTHDQELRLQHNALENAECKKWERKKIENMDSRVSMAKNMHKNHSIRINDICSTLKISRASLYRYLTL